MLIVVGDVVGCGLRCVDVGTRREGLTKLVVIAAVFTRKSVCTRRQYGISRDLAS